MAVPVVSTDSDAAYVGTVCDSCGTEGRVRLRAHEAHALATTLLTWHARIPPLDVEVPKGAGGKWWKQ